MSRLQVSGDLDERLPAVLDGRPPGLALAVVASDGTCITASTGQADLARRVAASPRMVCPWISMTKLITATAAMRLVERGLLALDAPIARHIPQFARLRPERDARRITARHLLTHSAGLANPIPVRWIHPADAPAVDQESLLDGLLAKRAKLRFEPGAKAGYSNLGTLSLGMALTHLAGVPFADVVEREVLRPVGMNGTGFAYSDDTSARAATGYDPRWSPVRVLLPRWALGSPAGRWISLKPFLLDGRAYGGWWARSRTPHASCRSTYNTANSTAPGSSQRKPPSRCGRSSCAAGAATSASDGFARYAIDAVAALALGARTR